MFPTQPSFIGENVYLRAPNSDDPLNFYYWSVQSELQSLSCRPLPVGSPGSVIERYKNKEQGVYNQDFSIVKKEDNRLVGKTTYFDYNPQNRSAEIGIIIDPDERENGFASEAIYLLCNYLFNNRGLNKVYAQTAEFNKGAMKLLKSSGFKQDAKLRDHYFFDSEFHNGLIFSILLYEFKQ